VVVLPTPPFWLTMASTVPTRYSGSTSGAAFVPDRS
jgi:hypothetical protein